MTTPSYVDLYEPQPDPPAAPVVPTLAPPPPVPGTVSGAIQKAENVSVALAPSGAVQLNTLDEALRFCKWAVESGLLPNGIKTVAQAFVILQKGAELGFSPMASFEFIYPVNGRPRLMPAGALAKVKSSGLLADYDERTEGEGETLQAIVTSLRKGAQRPMATVFTWQDAKRAGLIGKDNWKNWPKRMVLARARGFNLQDNFTDLLGGLQVRETFDLDASEVIDVNPARMPPAMMPPPAGPDPLLADEEGAPCCGRPHKPSEKCPTSQR